MVVKELQWNSSHAKIFWAAENFSACGTQRENCPVLDFWKRWRLNLVSLRTPVSWDCCRYCVYSFLMVIKSQICGWAEDLESAPKVLFLSVCHCQHTGWFFSAQALGLTWSHLSLCQYSGQAWSQVKAKPCQLPGGCSLNIFRELKFSWQAGPR